MAPNLNPGIDPRHAEVVDRELLELVFESAPRAMVSGVLFAAVCAYVLRESLTAPFALAWLGAVFVINASRAALASAYFRSNRAPGDLARWRRRAVIGYACVGMAWGVMIAAAILRGPLVQQYAVFMIFAIVTTFQAVGRANYPVAIRAYLVAAFIPMVAAAAGEDGRAGIVIAFLAVFALAITRIGAHSHRVMANVIASRHENARLLASLTAQKDALDEANRAKTRFLAAASHDLRQPMQAITLLVESLQERSREPATRAIVESIRSSVGTMAALLNAILDISRFDAGTVRPERSHFALGPILERLRHAHAEAAKHKGLRLRVVRSSVVVETDAVLLYRILSNLVANAVRYTERGGVVVGCRRHAQGVSIEVWDSGPGIDEAQQREIFREFVQLGNPQRDREQGLGLGLAIVERTSRLLGHRLELRSRPGKGSMFALHVGYGDPAQVRVSAAAGAEPLKGCVVLVVEDQREVRAAMALLLTGWGCVVHVADSGSDARDQIARLGEAPDIVIADYRLPGEQDGVAVLDDIRRRFPGSGGILVSGDIGPEALRRAQDSGYTLLHKPLRPARLRALMGNLWRARAAPGPAAPAEAA